MITITPSQSGILDLSTVNDYATATVEFTSSPSVSPNQWFWIIMRNGEDRWLIRDPAPLSTTDINYGVEAIISKPTLLRLPNGANVTFLAYADGNVIDEISLKVTSSGDSGEYKVVDFEDESVGFIQNPTLDKKLILFHFGNHMQVHPEIISDTGGKRLSFTVFGNYPSHAQFTNKSYSTVSFDITTSTDSSVTCQSLNPKDSRSQTVLAGANRHMEFIMTNIELLVFRPNSSATGSTITIDNFKMK